MSSITFFFLFVSILALVFLIVNLLLAPHNPYQEKYSIFECGFHSFLGQNRIQFGIKFFMFALIYLLLDLEIVAFLPFTVSAYSNSSYGLIIALLFILAVTVGFVFELGKSALKIDSRQVITPLKEKSFNVTELIGKFLVDKEVINNINIIKLAEDKLNQNKPYSESQIKKSNLDIIFSFTDISKLYLINKDFFVKFSSIILYILITLLGISLFMAMFKLRGIDLFLYFNGLTIVASLVMVSLIFINIDLLIKLYINSIYVISNMLLLSLISSILIYIVINILPFNFSTLSLSDGFNLSRAVLGILLSFKLTVNTVTLIYVNWKNPKILIQKLFLLVLSLIAITFFYQVFSFIFSIFSVLVFSLNEKNFDNSSELNLSELNKKNLSESKILDNSLNHNLKKNYPLNVHGKGPYLYTDDGRQIFDASSGAGVANIGYGNQKVVDAITSKYSKGAHYSATAFWKDEDCLKLAEFLTQSTGNQLTKVFLTVSGSDATEAAIKIARQYYYDQDNETQRHIIIAREDSYHGNTIGALSVSNFLLRQLPYSPLLMKNVEYISSCYPYRQQMDGESDAAFVARKAEELENKINELGPEKVMLVIMEPVSGAALGCVPAVPGYLKAMRDVCDKYGILFALDEVMCGMGRTGSFHAWQEEGVLPDIEIIGKGLAAGYYPLSAVLVAPKVWEALNSEFVHGLTFDAAPVGAVAALNVHQIIQENNLLDNVFKQGNYLGESLKTKLADHPNVGDIRGKGLFWGIELVKDKTTKEPFDFNVGVAEKIVNMAFSEYNMTIYKGTGGAGGLNGDHVMIHPPYTITANDVDHIVEVITAVIERVFKEIN